MWKFYKNPIRHCLEGMIGLILLTGMQILAQANSEEGRPSGLPGDQNTSAKPTIAEERAKLEFYHYSALTEEDLKASRLSDQYAQYPVEPVERLHPLLELGDPFVGNGPIRPGIRTPAGQMLQPWFLLYGSLRSVFQSYDDGRRNSIEWANRLDLNGNINLTGTERVLFSLRPLDSQSGNYSGYSFEPNGSEGWQEDFNSRLFKLYFEGELGEIFPGLDPGDSDTYDVGFSVGRQQLFVQDGILINDNIDSIGITRNSLVFDGIANLRLTGLYGWNHINRGNNDIPFRVNYHSANLFGLLAEADTALNNTMALDALYVGGEGDQNAWYAGVASTQRFGSLNSTFRISTSIPAHGETLDVGRGVLLLSQLSTSFPGTDDNVYFNAFWSLGRFTSAARSPDLGSPVANLGILYGSVAMGRYGVPLGGRIDDTIGTAIGYQMFLDGIDSQLIFEISARASTRDERDEGALGFGLRYERAIGKRHLLRLDSFVAGREGVDLNYGLRTEWTIKF
jgi:hypothetical protein